MLQIWFGISEYAKTGKYLEGRMRSHPLVVKLGDGEAPGMRDLGNVKMYELDEGFAEVQHEFGADLYKAADWRCAAHATLISFHAEQDTLCIILLNQIFLQHFHVLQMLLPAFHMFSACHFALPRLPPLHSAEMQSRDMPVSLCHSCLLCILVL